MLSLVGVGGAGCNIVEQFFKKDIVGSIISKISPGAAHVRGVAIDTSESIKDLKCIPPANMVLIGSSRAKGHGTGGSVEIGEKIMKEELELAMSAVRKANEKKPEAVFMIMGMGGGTGTGGAPVLAKRIKATYNVPLIGIIILPARTEGSLYTKNTFENLERVTTSFDGVMVLDNGTLTNRGEDLAKSYKIMNRAIFNFLSMARIGDIMGLVEGDITTIGFLRTKAKHIAIKEALEKAIRDNVYFDIENKKFEKFNMIVHGNLSEVYGQSFAKKWASEKYGVEVDYIFMEASGSKYLNIGLIITGLKGIEEGYEIEEDKEATSELEDLLGDIKPLL